TAPAPPRPSPASARTPPPPLPSPACPAATAASTSSRATSTPAPPAAPAPTPPGPSPNGISKAPHEVHAQGRHRPRVDQSSRLSASPESNVGRPPIAPAFEELVRSDVIY